MNKIPLQTKHTLVKQLNLFGKNKQACFFLIDFLGTKGLVYQLNQQPKAIQFSTPHHNTPNTNANQTNITIKPKAMPFDEYFNSYQKVHNNILKGNSYLCNLTLKTPIEINASLTQVYNAAKAKYKLLWQDNLLCFSPETFVQINQNKISSNPMKGTIDANLPNAKNIILNSLKEKAEHNTIVDLIRNDLSKIATKVSVERFRYVDEIKSPQGNLLQVSSEISGTLPNNWHHHLGDILFDLLPAGSVSGAPKDKTLEIIKNAEAHQREFYTGIFGVFDGENLDSAVLIRYIKQENQQFFYFSGGGITHLSNPHDEYKEALKKIYVPTN